MRLPRLGRRGPEVPAEVAGALGERGREVLSVAQDERSGSWVVATTTHVYAVRDGSVVIERPWHMVDTGSWDDQTRRLTVQWVDRAPATVWQIQLPSTFPQVFRERVQASVVLSDEVDLGDKRRARVVVRKDLETQALLGQTILGRGVRSSDPGVREQTAAALGRLREQVGLD
ncbi:hypothetical protein N798_02850 [Knoellia flava TL1]|uniref:Uncharacterized protein n=2 Tax=Knoellia flava TaxID=913969 RepID=A0A8H9KPD7_9MICO|nr:hypothetical protein [Knoellia flava]KGN35422.1 hypothetical protein N798_02850 [Knoellia flava TL1]GGB69078.1 hypothetical protein GCM10011314_05440 [Knoellia flava]